MTNNEKIECCKKCKYKLTGDLIKCSGVCEDLFHVKCFNITKTLLNALNESNNILFLCDDCKDSSVKSIGNNLKKIISCLHINEERTIRNEEKNITKLLRL